MTVTQLRRTGSGELENDLTEFQWSGLSHSSMQGILNFKLGTKIARKEMPGSNDVVHHAMSATWQPFPLSGEWRDIWMSRPGPTAYEIYLDFAALAQKIPTVRVTIDKLSFVGIIQDLEIEYHHEAWIGWKFMLSPESNENVSKGSQDITFLPEKSIPEWINQSASQGVDLHEIFAFAGDIPLSTEDLQDSIDATKELDDAIAKITTLGGASGLEGLSADLVSGINNVGSDVTDIVWALPTLFERVNRAAINVAVAVKDQRADLALAYDDFIQSLKFEEYVHATTSGAWRIVGSSHDAAADMRRRSSQGPIAIYRPKPGESLERISTRFYGTPDNADLIYRTNHLTSLVLSGTEELLIPAVGA